MIIPNEVINLLVPLLSHCHNTVQHTHTTLLLGPYFPKRGESVPSPTAKNIPRATRPMLQMAIPHSQIELVSGYYYYYFYLDELNFEYF